ncbi:MAG: DUF5067 domain-containing protein [Eggerthellaceae bacterium]|nr:DUF5067 domain-containing protein [Eggerthellaceae bacterium]
MKRKILAVVLALSVVSLFPLTGCGSPKPMFDASLDKVFIAGSYDGTLLVVNLNIKNNAQTNISGSMAQLYATATLDGKTLGSAWLSDKHPEAVDAYASITPQAEGKGQLVFDLPAGAEGTVELVITVDTLDHRGVVEVLNESINLADVEAIVSESEFEVVVNSVTVTDDGNGKDLLVLNVTFTNNSADAVSFGGSVKTQLFQNGIELKMGWLPFNHPLEKEDMWTNSSVDLKQGLSIDIQQVYELQDSKSPVELTYTDWASLENIVVLEKTIDVAGASKAA